MVYVYTKSKAMSVCSRSPGGGLLVKAGITAEPIVSSSSLNIGPIPGMVRLKYVHLLHLLVNEISNYACCRRVLLSLAHNFDLHAFSCCRLACLYGH